MLVVLRKKCQMNLYFIFFYSIASAYNRQIYNKETMLTAR